MSWVIHFTRLKKDWWGFFYIVCFAVWGETVNPHETKEADKAES